MQMRILLVKTSSLGDVIHNLPVLTDLHAHFPDAMIDWVVEEGFAEIPRLHPSVHYVIPIAVRRWKKHLRSRATWREMAAFRNQLQSETYDLIIDTQGLFKSAVITWLARGRRCGYAAGSAREPLAARAYHCHFNVPTSLHAVERNRLLVAQAAGYSINTVADYGLTGVKTAYLAGGRPSAVLLTATSRDDKLWPEESWIALGHALHERGLECFFPAGNAVERERAARLAQAIPDAVALPPLSLTRLAETLAVARLVVGVDTGLAHLAAALGRPTLALFCASDPELTGVHAGEQAINLGGRNAAPTAAAVITAVAGLL